MIRIKFNRIILITTLLLYFVSQHCMYVAVSQDTDEKTVMLEEKVKEDPNDVEALKELAERYEGYDMSDKSIEAYERVIILAPADVASRKRLAQLYSWNDRENDAIKEYGNILGYEPDNIEIMISLANNYKWNGRMKDSEKMFKKILEKEPDNIQAKMGMADLYSATSRPDKAVGIYSDIIDEIKDEEAKKEAYDRMAENYYNTQSYGDAREFYKKLLDIDPANPAAQRRLDDINRLAGPGIFGQFDYYQGKGGRYRYREEAGGTYVFEDGFRIKASGIIESEIDRDTDEDNYKNTYAVPLEVSKYLGDGLTFFAGVSWVQFRSIRTFFNYFVSYIKTFGDSMTMEFGYSRSGLEQQQYQHVDRHRINHTMYYTPIEYFSIATYVSPFYLTKGDAPNNNYGVEFSITPIVHVMRENPSLDLSYTYYQGYYHRKDNLDSREYEYYNPNHYMTNSVTAFIHYDFNETFWLEASNSYTLWGIDEYMKYFTENTVTVEYSYLFDKKRDGRIGVAYYWFRRLEGRIEDSQDAQRWTVRYSQSF